MDQELKDYLDEIRSEVQQTRVLLHDEIQQTRVLVDKQGDEIQQLRISIDKQGEEIRHTGVLLERQHDDIRQVAEGVMGTNESLDSFRMEISQQLDQVRSLISPPYTDLNRRVKLLESWKERKDRDPVELVRERFGKPKN